MFYNFGLFSLLAYSPFPLEAAAHAAGIAEFGAHQLGAVFCGWGLCLALTSVFAAPRLTRAFGRTTVLYAMLAALAIMESAMALFVPSLVILVVCIIVAGLFLGVMSTVLTEAVMEATTLPRSVASSFGRHRRGQPDPLTTIDDELVDLEAEAIGAGVPA